MVFNPITKQAIEVIFSTKKEKHEHAELVFNGIPISCEEYINHLIADLTFPNTYVKLLLRLPIPIRFHAGLVV